MRSVIICSNSLQYFPHYAWDLFSLSYIYVNDLPKIVTSTMYMLADDTKLYHPISTDSDAISL